MRLGACWAFGVGLLLFWVNPGPASPSRSFDIRAYGAQADASDESMAAVQQAIKACAESGGGTVVVPAGTYIIGPIELAGNLTLCLEAGAVLKGSENLADYSQAAGDCP